MELDKWLRGVKRQFYKNVNKIFQIYIMSYLDTSINPPIIQTEQKILTKYSIQLLNFVLHKHVTLCINLFTDDNIVCYKTINYLIEGEEYQQWGNDDTYIDTIVQRELDKLRNTN